MTGELDKLESIDRRLELLVSMEAKKRIEGLETNNEKVLELHEIGFDTGEMAEIINTTPASVRAARSSLKKRGEINE